MIDDKIAAKIRNIANNQRYLRWLQDQRGLPVTVHPIPLDYEEFQAITETLPQLQLPLVEGWSMVAPEVCADMTARMRQRQCLLLDRLWVPVILPDDTPTDDGADDFLDAIKDMQIKIAYAHPFGVRVQLKHAAINLTIRLHGVQGEMSPEAVRQTKALREIYDALSAEVLLSVSLDAAKKIVAILREDNRSES